MKIILHLLPLMPLMLSTACGGTYDESSDSERQDTLDEGNPEVSDDTRPDQTRPDQTRDKASTITNCNAAAQGNINSAFSYLKQKDVSTVMYNQDTGYPAGSSYDGIIKAYASTYIKNMSWVCKPCTNKHGSTTGNASATICATVTSHPDFCTLVETMAHEFAHNIGVLTGTTQKPKHNVDDAVYRFGRGVYEKCNKDKGFQLISW